MPQQPSPPCSPFFGSESSNAVAVTVVLVRCALAPELYLSLTASWPSDRLCFCLCFVPSGVASLLYYYNPLSIIRTTNRQASTSNSFTRLRLRRWRRPQTLGLASPSGGPPRNPVFGSGLPPHSALRGPQLGGGGGGVPLQNGAKDVPEATLDGAQGTSVRVRDASTPIGRARQQPAAFGSVSGNFGPFSKMRQIISPKDVPGPFGKIEGAYLDQFGPVLRAKGWK